MLPKSIVMLLTFPQNATNKLYVDGVLPLAVVLVETLHPQWNLVEADIVLQDTLNFDIYDKFSIFFSNCKHIFLI